MRKREEGKKNKIKGGNRERKAAERGRNKGNKKNKRKKRNGKKIGERNKTLGRARDPRANGAWLNKLTE